MGFIVKAVPSVTVAIACVAGCSSISSESPAANIVYVPLFKLTSANNLNSFEASSSVTSFMYILKPLILAFHDFSSVPKLYTDLITHFGTPTKFVQSIVAVGLNSFISNICVSCAMLLSFVVLLKPRVTTIVSASVIEVTNICSFSIIITLSLAVKTLESSTSILVVPVELIAVFNVLAVTPSFFLEGTIE